MCLCVQEELRLADFLDFKCIVQLEFDVVTKETTVKSHLCSDWVFAPCWSHVTILEIIRVLRELDVEGSLVSRVIRDFDLKNVVWKSACRKCVSLFVAPCVKTNCCASDSPLAFRRWFEFHHTLISEGQRWIVRRPHLDNVEFVCVYFVGAEYEYADECESVIVCQMF